MYLCIPCPHFTISLQHTTQTSMPPTGFEPAIPPSDRPQTLALDRSATGRLQHLKVLGTHSRQSYNNNNNNNKNTVCNTSKYLVPRVGNSTTTTKILSVGWREYILQESQLCAGSQKTLYRYICTHNYDAALCTNALLRRNSVTTNSRHTTPLWTNRYHSGYVTLSPLT